MKRLTATLIILVVGGAACLAGETQEDLLRRIEKLEATAAAASPADGVKAGRSAVDVKLGGYIKFDMSYSDSRLDQGDFARWVEDETGNEDDDQSNATANQTRLWLTFKGPDTETMKMSGKIEVGFYGGGAENKANPMMRHAFVQVEWPDMELKLLAGQTSDVISPIVPTTVNYSVQWWAGDIGYRRPQIRLTKDLRLGGDFKLSLTGALTRTIGDPDGAGGTPPFTPGDTGEDSGWPTVQARIGLDMPSPLVDGKLVKFGVWGHGGEEEYDRNATGSDITIHSWSVGSDLVLPVADKVVLKGEWFRGANLDAYLGGIGQGINARREGIVSTGWWASAGIGPFGNDIKTSFNLGASVDDPDNGDLDAGDRSLNRSAWVNVMCVFGGQFEVGLEFSSWETKYKGVRDTSDAARGQIAFTYRF